MKTVLGCSVSVLALAFSAPAMATSGNAGDNDTAGATESQTTAVPAQPSQQARTGAAPQKNPTTNAPADESGAIIVTAQKRAERLQEVPQTVNVVSGDTVKKLNLLNFSDIAQLAPGLSLTSQEPSVNSITLRGVGFNPNSASSPTVDTYFNETPLDTNSAFRSLYDVGQIEVLRGPQGTLRGRTSPSGAITIATRRPDLHMVDGYFQQTLTTEDGFNSQGAIGVPIINDVLAVRVAGLIDHNIGLGAHNISNGLHDKDRTESARASVVFRPVSNLTINATYQYLNDRTIASPILFTLPGEVTDPILTPADRTAKETLPAKYKYKGNLFTWSADWDLGNAALTYIGGYQNIDRGRSTDLAYGGSLPGFSQPQFYTSGLKQFSQELRLSSQHQHFWNYLFGAYYEHDNSGTVVDQTQYIPIGFNFPADLLGFNVNINIPNRANTYALFTDQRFQLTDKLQLEGGLRYQSTHQNRDFVLTLTGPIFPVPVVQSAISPDNRRVTYRQLTGSASIRYDFSPDLTGYFTYGRSYRPGGVNTTTAALDESLLVYKPETSDNFELGLKGAFANRRISFSVALYQQNFTNYLAYTGAYLAVSTAKNGIADNNAAFVFNANARVRGIEGYIGGRISDHLSLGLSATYNDAKFLNALAPCNDFNGDGIPDSVGNPSVPIGQNVAFCRLNGRLSDQAPWGASLNGEYMLPLSARHDFFVRGLLSYVPKRTDPFQNIHYDDLLNNSLFIGVRAHDDAYEFEVFGKNLANVATLTTRGAAQVDYSFIPTGYAVGTPVAHREFGVIARVRF
jgi:iron complex outermembrane receptor protein